MDPMGPDSVHTSGCSGIIRCPSGCSCTLPARAARAARALPVTIVRRRGTQASGIVSLTLRAGKAPVGFQVGGSLGQPTPAFPCHGKSPGHVGTSPCTCAGVLTTTILSPTWSPLDGQVEGSNSPTTGPLTVRLSG